MELYIVTIYLLSLRYYYINFYLLIKVFNKLCFKSIIKKDCYLFLLNIVKYSKKKKLL